MTIRNRGLWLAVALLSSAPAVAVEPSPVEATGVINAEHGADASNWDLAPYNMYTFTQTEKIFPTLLISRGHDPVSQLDYSAEQIDISKITVVDPATGQQMALDGFLDRRMHNDGLIVIHKNRIVHESYRNNLTPDTRHITMSVSKSLIGMLAQIAKQRGLFNEDDLASKYVEELQGKEAWKDVTVRQIWDMRDGIKFVEDYDDDNSDVRIQDRATGWRKRGPDDPKGLRDYVKQNLNDKAHPSGQIFNYASIQSEILAMVIEGASGQELEEFFETELWARLGAEHPAAFGTDGFGQPLAQGTLNITLRDFARVALFVLDKGRNHLGEQLVDERFFDDLLTPNEELSQAFVHYSGSTGDSFYRSQFWITDADKKQFRMSGVHGQMAYFDFEQSFALVAFGSYPTPSDPLDEKYRATLRDAFLKEILYRH